VRCSWVSIGWWWRNHCKSLTGCAQDVREGVTSMPE
jgi:hypothetical protein